MNKLPCVYSLQATTGKGRGKKLGIPTINFRIPSDLTLAHGIYAGYLIVGHNKYKVAIHFGPRPQFDERDPSLEVYIMSGKLKEYPNTASIEFKMFVRKIRKFESVALMLRRIEQDVEEINAYLNSL